MHTTTVSGTNSDREYVSRVLQQEEIPAWWDALEPFVVSGLKLSQHELTAEDIRKFLLKGFMQAFVTLQDDVIEFAITTEIATFPQYKVLRIVTLAGKHLSKAQQFLPDLENWALMMGCTEIEGWAHAQHERLYRRRGLGFSTVYHVLRKNLRGRLQ